jgi:predicted secreted protein
MIVSHNPTNITLRCGETKCVILCFLLILFSFFTFLHARVPDTLWARTYGGANIDVAYSVCQTSDGGYAITGYTYSFGAGQQDAYLVKTNSTGDTMWTATFGGTGMDGTHFVREVSDGYVLAGYTESFGGTGKNVYLIKTDTAGTAQHACTYSTSLMDVAYAFCETPDSGYIFVGYKNGPSGWVKGDLWVLRTDGELDTLWTKAYGGVGEDYGISIQPTLDSCYIISGTTSSFGAGGKDVWLVKINASGDTVWTRTYGFALEDVGYGVNTTADSGFIITGYINGTGAWTAGDLWLLKTDPAGILLWDRIYGGSGEDFGFDVYPTFDDGYAIAGRRDTDIWFLRTDFLGDTLGTRTYGGAGMESALALYPTSDNGYVIGGYTSSFGSGSNDFWLLKTSADVGVEDNNSFNINCDHVPATIVTGQLNLPIKGNYRMYDISGRIVTANKIAKGIYFVEVDGSIIHKIVKVQ